MQALIITYIENSIRDALSLNRVLKTFYYERSIAVAINYTISKYREKYHL
ncbi:hypothetical protein Tcan_11631 [Toxocara canis]|uniref:Uncharacterized protein n=1 Tax=Toxocara canis TaxID=6265 RepID=A0A0B2VQA9_TOXCA|nr:hypothetical protein Tcan_11631 [Toxocara canis]